MRFRTIVALTVVVYALFFGYIAYTLHAPAPVCVEDMACWDCSTMGNQICGKDG